MDLSVCSFTDLKFKVCTEYQRIVFNTIYLKLVTWFDGHVLQNAND